MFADTAPSLDQRVSDAGTTVGLTGRSVDHPDFRKQGTILYRPVTLGRPAQA